MPSREKIDEWCEASRQWECAGDEAERALYKYINPHTAGNWQIRGMEMTGSTLLVDVEDYSEDGEIHNLFVRVDLDKLA